MDLFHIAIAIEIGAEALLTFDTDQIYLAEAAGVSVFNLARGPRKLGN
jgi:predicted nucleic acid-binding protein